MSEIGWYKSKIKLANMNAYASNIEANSSFQMLKRSLELVAKEHGGMVTKFVMDSYGRKTLCDLAIKTPEFQRGIGLKINRHTGEVTFLYDHYGGYMDTIRKITGEITQNYVALALIKAMKSLGYEVEEEAGKQKETVVLIGRA